MTHLSKARSLGAVGYNGMLKNVEIKDEITMFVKTGYDSCHINTWLKSHGLSL